jgi:hypothetical protein
MNQYPSTRYVKYEGRLAAPVQQIVPRVTGTKYGGNQKREISPGGRGGIKVSSYAQQMQHILVQIKNQYINNYNITYFHVI